MLHCTHTHRYEESTGETFIPIVWKRGSDDARQQLLLLNNIHAQSKTPTEKQLLTVLPVLSVFIQVLVFRNCQLPTHHKSCCFVVITRSQKCKAHHTHTPEIYISVVDVRKCSFVV